MQLGLIRVRLAKFVRYLHGAFQLLHRTCICTGSECHRGRRDTFQPDRWRLASEEDASRQEEPGSQRRERLSKLCLMSTSVDRGPTKERRRNVASAIDHTQMFDRGISEFHNARKINNCNRTPPNKRRLPAGNNLKTKYLGLPKGWLIGSDRNGAATHPVKCRVFVIKAINATQAHARSWAIKHPGSCRADVIRAHPAGTGIA